MFINSAPQLLHHNESITKHADHQEQMDLTGILSGTKLKGVFFLCVNFPGKKMKTNLKCNHISNMSFLIYLFLERVEGRKKARERKRRRETSIGCTLHSSNQGPGLQPRQEPNWWPFDWWDYAQPTESHQSGPYL